MYSKLINREIDPYTEILVTSGAYEALHSAIHGFVIDKCNLRRNLFAIFQHNGLSLLTDISMKAMKSSS